MDMDIDPKGEASGAPDLNIKRETSDGLDGDTNMADIPASAVMGTGGDNGEPHSPQRPAPPLLTSPKDLPSEDSQTKASAAARATKKKGTATLVKKTTSRKTGSGSRAGRRVRGGSKSATPSSFRPQGNNGNSINNSSGSAGKGPGSSTASATASSPAPAGSSDAEGDESDHGPYCICRGPDDHRWMISCDVCEDWFHGECVAIDKTVGEALIQRYVCPRCTDGEGINVTRYKKTCSLDGCFSPARIYEETAGAARGDDGAAGRKTGAASGVGGANYSVFCSDRHAEDWWEQLVRALPENGRLKAKDADLTREKFMGLLNVSRAQQSVEGEEPWSIGKKPFGEFLLSSFASLHSLLRSRLHKLAERD